MLVIAFLDVSHERNKRGVIHIYGQLHWGDTDELWDWKGHVVE